MARLKAINSDVNESRNIKKSLSRLAKGDFTRIFCSPIAISPPKIPKKRMQRAMIAKLSIKSPNPSNGSSLTYIEFDFGA